MSCSADEVYFRTTSEVEGPGCPVHAERAVQLLVVGWFSHFLGLLVKQPPENGNDGWCTSFYSCRFTSSFYAALITPCQGLRFPLCYQVYSLRT
jgi:hypothetical protein